MHNFFSFIVTVLLFVELSPLCNIFTELAPWADSVCKLGCPSIVYCATFCGFLKRLITPIYKCRKSNWSIRKKSLREKLCNDIRLRFCYFGPEMVKNWPMDFLLMDLGHNQQNQHPTVYHGGVSRVPCCSPAHPLPLTFRSPSAPLPLFMDIFCVHVWPFWYWCNNSHWSRDSVSPVWGILIVSFVFWHV